MTAQPIQLDGDVAIVTGAGKGLGRAYAFELAARGAGHVGEVFIGATRGWYAPGLSDFGPEALVVQLPAIQSFDEFTVPEDSNGECRNIAAQLPPRV